MNRTVKIVFVACAGAATLVLTGACAGPDIERLRAAPLPPQGDSFNRTLAQEYLKFATFEADRMDDWLDARHFARKGLKAAAGSATQPERLADWRLLPGDAAKIARARKRLVEVLDGGARKFDGGKAAVTQASFDCWVEQQEEGFQDDHIAACRDRFFAALTELENRRSAKKPDTSAVLRESRYLVFFGHDAMNVDEKASRVIAAVSELAKSAGGRMLVVAGHADRSGTGEYNTALSQNRADAVRAALIRSGLRPQRILVTAHGETRPLVKTGDGVREPRNRRAEIILR